MGHAPSSMIVVDDMLRGLLTTYLIFATLAGPAWCCCVPAWLLNHLPATKTVATTHPPTARACCHAAKAVDTRHACASESRGAKQAPCCCPENRPQQPAAPPTTSTQVDAGAAPVIAPFGFCLFSTTVPITGPAPSSCASIGGFSSAHDFLNNLHLLRC